MSVILQTHNYTLDFTYEHCFVIHHHEPPSAMVHGASKTTLNLKRIENGVTQFILGDSTKGLWQETILKGKISGQSALATLIGEDRTILLDANFTSNNQLNGTLTFINIHEDDHQKMGSFIKVKFTGFPSINVAR